MPTSKTLAVFDAIAGRPPGSAFAQLDLRNATVVLDFDDAAVESMDFVGVLPRGYAGRDFELVITWAATSATSGAVVWQVEFERHPIADPTHGTHDLDTNGFGTPATSTATAPANSGELAQTTISLPANDADDPVAGESYRLRVSRVATSGLDTMTGDAELVAVELREV
ncbi:hypothetical protein [Aeoliella sp. SH292]|uniref:hypothetical protein n=1 Tax=Aeoliella sp. SH292 TaxID=3454464 RepID=UPI003F9B1787